MVRIVDIEIFLLHYLMMYLNKNLLIMIISGKSTNHNGNIGFESPLKPRLKGS